MRLLASGFLSLLLIGIASHALAGCPRDIHALKAKLGVMSEGNIKNTVKRLVKRAEREFKAEELKQCNDTIAKAMVASTRKPVTRKPPVRRKSFNY